MPQRMAIGCMALLCLVVATAGYAGLLAYFDVSPFDVSPSPISVAFTMLLCANWTYRLRDGAGRRKGTR